MSKFEKLPKKVFSLLCNRYDVREGGAQKRPISELVWVEESKVSKASPENCEWKVNGFVSRHCDQGEGRVANTAIAALGEQQVIVGTTRVGFICMKQPFSCRH